jgi:uncharacterized protein YjaG (DUF416 family)
VRDADLRRGRDTRDADPQYLQGAEETLTTTPHELRGEVERRLEQLAHSHRLAFAAATLARLQPLYERFQQTEGRGDSAEVARANEQLWRLAEGHDERDLADLRGPLWAAIPDTEDFPSPDGSVAQAVAIAAYYAVDYGLAERLESLLEVVHHAEEAVRMPVADEEEEREVAAELRRQLADLELLGREADVAAAIARLRG